MRNNDNKISICIMITSGISLYNANYQIPFGGAEVQLYFLSRELSRYREFSINVIVGDSDLKRKYKLNNKDIEIIVSQPLKTTFINYFRRPFNLFTTLLKIRPDIIILGGNSVNVGLCAFYCKLFKKKLIFAIVHEIDVSKKISKSLIGKLYNYGLNNASYIVAQHNDQIRKLENWKQKTASNVKVIKYGYKLKHIINKEKEFILWVARAVDWKRPGLFLKLVENFPNEKFVMICNKSQNTNQLFFRSLVNFAKKYSNVKLLESVPFQEIDQYFQKAKVFVNTSIYEGFPNTFIQAFKNKTPVISLNVNSDQIFTKNEIGFYCNNHFSEMKQNLKRLIEDPTLYNYYSENAFLFAQNNHDIKKISKEWFYLIKKLVLYEKINNP